MIDLSKRSIHALLWGGGGAVLRLALQFSIQVVMLRLLGPDQYGVFALCVLVVSLAVFVADFGVSYGLIQKPTVSEQDIRFVMGWQLVVGSSVSVGLALAAPRLAMFFDEPESAAPLGVLALVCLISAIASPSLNLLKRAMDFKRIQIAALCGYLCGYVLVGLPIAVATRSYWAPVAAWLVQVVVAGGIQYAAARHPLRPSLLHSGGAGMIRFGLLVLVTNLVNWLGGSIDRFVVAQAFGARAVGLYSAANNLVYTPTSAALGAVQPAFYAAASKRQDSPQIVAQAYLALLAAIALFALPLFVVLAVLSGPLVQVLYGAAWIDASDLLRPLALAMPFLLMWGMSTPVLWAGGKPEREVMSQLPMSALAAAMCLLAAQHSAAAVAWTVAVLAVVRFCVGAAMLARVASLRVFDIWRALRGGFVLALVLAITAFAVDAFGTRLALGSVGRLLMASGCVLVVAAAALAWLPSLKAVDLVFLHTRVARHAPTWAVVAIDWLLRPALPLSRAPSGRVSP